MTSSLARARLQTSTMSPSWVAGCWSAKARRLCLGGTASLRGPENLDQIDRYWNSLATCKMMANIIIVPTHAYGI